MTGTRRGDPDQALAPVVREDDIRPLGTRAGSRAAAVMLVAVAVAIAVALVKPWGSGPLGSDGATSQEPDTFAPGPSSAQSLVPSTPDPDDGSSTCNAPVSWRTATIESWFGRLARVWTAAEFGSEAVDDPGLEFVPIISERVMAIGWCAPGIGPERPPLAARGRLWADGPDGLVIVPVVRLEPAAPNALGELWAPVGRPGASDAAWPPGRYVIELRTPTGGWRRVVGLDVRTARADPLPGASPATPAPSTSAPPSGSPPSVGS